MPAYTELRRAGTEFWFISLSHPQQNELSLYGEGAPYAAARPAHIVHTHKQTAYLDKQYTDLNKIKWYLIYLIKLY